MTGSNDHLKGHINLARVVDDMTTRLTPAQHLVNDLKHIRRKTLTKILGCMDI